MWDLLGNLVALKDAYKLDQGSLLQCQAVEAAVTAGVRSGEGGAALPGMIFNQSKKVTYRDAVSGEEKSVYAGRMECTMQVCLPKAPHGLSSLHFLKSSTLCEVKSSSSIKLLPGEPVFWCTIMNISCPQLAGYRPCPGFSTHLDTVWSLPLQGCCCLALHRM